MTLVAILVGAVIGVSVGLVCLAIAGMVYACGMDAAGRSESVRTGCRRDAGKCERCSRPAEPDRDALARALRRGWIDMDTARGERT